METKKKLSKIGEWLRSDSKPLMDMSLLDEEEQKKIMRLALR